MDNIKIISLITLFISIFNPNSSWGSDNYKVLYINGKSTMERNNVSRALFINDLLTSGDILKTKSKSLVILGFGKGYSSKLKLGQNSKIRLDKPSFEKKEKLFFQNIYLEIGNLVIKYINQNKGKESVKVKTKTASIGVRGTTFFVNVNPSYETLIAVQSGLVLASSMAKRLNLPITENNGVVFSSSGSSGKLSRPTWYDLIKWSTDENAKLKTLQQDQNFDLKGQTKLKHSFKSIKSDDINKVSLNTEEKNLKNNCFQNKNGSACSKLGLILLKTTKIEDSKKLIQSVFNKGCEYKENQACIWSSRIELEFGNKESSKKYLVSECEKGIVYACYTLWEESKRYGNDTEASKYEAQIKSHLNGENINDSISIFKSACDSDDAISCSNLGILLDQFAQSDKAIPYYQKGCDLGDGSACSNLGFIYQTRSNIELAKELYQKSCFLNEEYGCYNLACHYSRVKNTKLALQYLELALISGYNDFIYLEKDSDLENIRDNKNYKNLIKKFNSQ